MEILGYEFMEDRFYDKEHNWIKKEGDVLRIGVTEFFQKMANEIIFVDLPAAGRALEAGKPFASVESGKWVGRIKTVIDGAITDNNKELSDFPYLVNESPYDEGWMILVAPSDPDFAAGLLDLTVPEQRQAYKDYLLAEKQRIEKLAE